MSAVWPILLLGLGGVLIGSALSTWRSHRLIAAGLAACGVLAAAAGVLRLDVFGA
jgi:hypothetical protein